VEVIRGDLADADALRRAVRGCDLVIHTAAKVGVTVAYEPFHKTNVDGTQNVIDACRAEGVKRLVYTSSPSVVFAGDDLENVDESLPYPERHHAHYAATKALAERMVLEANDASLRTVSLRPHLIWGPRDNHLVPRIIARAKRLRRIGSESKLVDSTYIDNAADAHLLAADRLTCDSPLCGKPYFISNGEPRPIWDLINGILAAADRPPVTRSIPLGLARAVGACLEGVYGALRLSGEPPMTRFLASELSTAHWFDLSAARRDLGYEPRVSIDEGLRRLREWLREDGLKRYGAA
jgi:nucleoside-diphosphate-sugar epimerase